MFTRSTGNNNKYFLRRGEVVKRLAMIFNSNVIIAYNRLQIVNIKNVLIDRKC